MTTIRLNLFEETRYEKLAVKVYAEQHVASVKVAGHIDQIIRDNQKSVKNAVLGLATGVTPLGVNRELVRSHREDCHQLLAQVLPTSKEYDIYVEDKMKSDKETEWIKGFLNKVN